MCESLIVRVRIFLMYALFLCVIVVLFWWVRSSHTHDFSFPLSCLAWVKHFEKPSAVFRRILPLAYLFVQMNEVPSGVWRSLQRMNQTCGGLHFFSEVLACVWNCFCTKTFQLPSLNPSLNAFHVSCVTEKSFLSLCVVSTLNLWELDHYQLYKLVVILQILLKDRFTLLYVSWTPLGISLWPEWRREAVTVNKTSFSVQMGMYCFKAVLKEVNLSLNLSVEVSGEEVFPFSRSSCKNPSSVSRLCKAHFGMQGLFFTQQNKSTSIQHNAAFRKNSLIIHELHR